MKEKVRNQKKDKLEKDDIKQQKTTKTITKVDKKQKVNRFSDKQQTEQEPNEKGVVYVGHLPSGFVEEGLYQYFQQFGKITKVKLARSKKSARSKGYGWVQFELKEIARMAAQTLNGYIIYGKQIQAKYLDEKELLQFKNPFEFKKGLKKYKFVDWQQKFIDKRNKALTDQEIKVNLENLLKKEEEKRQKIKDLGINFEFPGFRQILSIKQ